MITARTARRRGGWWWARATAASGDGILYKLAVIDATGEETIIAERVVAEHAWLPIEGDLTPWAGQTVRLKLIIDAGADDNTSGDWACAAEMRIETLQPQLLRMLEGSTEAMRREPGPFPVGGLTIEDLRGARSGRVHYDGIGLSGTGEAYGSFAVLNGVELGNMTPAGGSEAQGVWAEDVTVELTPEAIATLGFRNLFEVHNPKRDWFRSGASGSSWSWPTGARLLADLGGGLHTQPPGGRMRRASVCPSARTSLWRSGSRGRRDGRRGVPAAPAIHRVALTSSVSRSMLVPSRSVLGRTSHDAELVPERCPNSRPGNPDAPACASFMSVTPGFACPVLAAVLLLGGCRAGQEDVAGGQAVAVVRPAPPPPHTHHDRGGRCHARPHEVGKRIEANGAESILADVRDDLRAADLTIANLECPLADKGPHVPDDCIFRADPDTVRSPRRRH